MPRQMKSKRSRRTAVPRPMPNSVTLIQRRVTSDIIKGTGSVDTGLYRNVTLATFPTSDINSLFTDYKIVNIQVTYQLYTQPNNNANFPTLFVAPQHLINTLTPPANRDEVLQFRDVKTHQFGPSALSVKYNYKPYIKTSDGLVYKAPWISVANTTVAHMFNVEFLSKYNLATDNSHTIQLNVLATVLCRRTR